MPKIDGGWLGRVEQVTDQPPRPTKHIIKAKRQRAKLTPPTFKANDELSKHHSKVHGIPHESAGRWKNKDTFDNRFAQSGLNDQSAINIEQKKMRWVIIKWRSACCLVLLPRSQAANTKTVHQQQSRVWSRVNLKWIGKIESAIFLQWKINHKNLGAFCPTKSARRLPAEVPTHRGRRGQQQPSLLWGH